MTREVMDAIPQGRNIQAIGIMIPGTALQVGGGGALSRDVGGSGSLQQSPLSYRGSVASVQTVEGMRLNNLCGSGQYSGNYWNDGMFQEISYSTGADSAEMGQGGLRINMIPEGWRQHVPRHAVRQLDRRVVERRQPDRRSAPARAHQRQRGQEDLRLQSVLRRPDQARPTVVPGDVPPAGAREDGRRQLSSTPIPIRFATRRISTRPGVDDGWIMSGVVRLTWQATQKNKVTGYFDRQKKSRGHWGISSTNPPEASAIQVTPLSYTGNIKWTSTLASKLLFEAGYAHYYQEYDELYQPAVTPTTYRITDQTTGRACCAYNSEQYHFSTLRTYSGKLSYVTGAHNLTGGITVSEGPRRTVTRQTGQISMRFGATTSPAHPSGFGPNQITMNLPTDQREGIYADTGVWVNDKWTIKRATITAGPALRLVRRRSARVDDSPERLDGGRDVRGLQERAELEGPVAATGLRLRPVRQRQDRAQGSASRATSTRRRSALRPAPTRSACSTIARASPGPTTTATSRSSIPDGSVQDRDFNPNSTVNELAPLPASSTFGSLVQSNTRIDDAIREGWFVRGYSVGVCRRRAARAVPARVGRLQLLPPLHRRQRRSSPTT